MLGPRAAEATGGLPLLLAVGDLSACCRGDGGGPLPPGEGGGRWDGPCSQMLSKVLDASVTFCCRAPGALPGGAAFSSVGGGLGGGGESTASQLAGS